MLKELEYPFDPSFILKKKKSIKRSLLSDENQNNKRIKKNIAILGGGTTNDIKLVLELFLLHYGIEPHFMSQNTIPIMKMLYLAMGICLNLNLTSFIYAQAYITSLHFLT